MSRRPTEPRERNSTASSPVLPANVHLARILHERCRPSRKRLSMLRGSKLRRVWTVPSNARRSLYANCFEFDVSRGLPERRAPLYDLFGLANLTRRQWLDPPPTR